MRFLRYNILLLLPLLVASCNVSGRLKKANEAYEAGGYYKAARMYRNIAAKVDREKRGDIYFKIAEAYRITGNPTQAITAYNNAIRYKYTDPVVYLYSAQMLLMKDDWKKADVEEFEKQIITYCQLAPDDPRGKVVEDSYKLIEETGKSLTKYKVENINGFNTRYHEYSPAYASSDYETIYFTSSRPEGEKKRKVYDVTGQKPTDIFVTSLSKTGWTKPASLEGDVNDVYEEGSCTFDKSYTTMYFTQCRNENHESLGCGIYMSKLRSDAWGEPEQILIVHDSLVVAHPALSNDELTLYFISNMPGGVGGLDIWKITRSSDEGMWGEPVNLGTVINTRDNEMFPYMRGDSVLYFSSNGHPGFGGLDIFKSKVDSIDGSFKKIINLGKPINSNADDFSIIFEGENERGYFASRRKGGKGGDDIYSFALDIPVIEYFLTGSVRDAKTNTRLGNAEIKLTGSNGATLKKKTESNGIFEFRLSTNTDYIAVVTRDGYFAQKSKRISTKGLKESKTFTDTLYMISFEKPIEIPNIFFEFGKADLSPESTTSLDQLITIMNDNPNIVIELRAHTDSRGTDEVNMNLSQRRAQSIVDYLVMNGIEEIRMEARGYGKSDPRAVDQEIAAKYPFLKVGNRLDDSFINSLKDEEQKEICHALNRRTEMQVISDQYKPYE
ncbi:MAG: OmpA family protein [Prevotellaceae bacterium]|jgi:peptidoglycan-associated lipoprotein|nr:OmpA family protein [Prevotellaceae bacterium]